MKEAFLTTGQFARKASVTVRTLRFYDRVGLLSPSQVTEAGYRQYRESDLQALQQILALKFLGFSLEEIKACLKRDPDRFGESLDRQREMLMDRRKQLDSILKALGRTRTLLKESGDCDWSAVARLITEMQMEQKTEWMSKYFNPEQLATLGELNKEYSPEALEKLSQRGEWTEADQEKANEQWAFVATEAKRLSDAKADPAGEEGQALAKTKHGLISGFTQGDPELMEGLKRFWEAHSNLPEEQQPLKRWAPEMDEAASKFLDEVMAHFEKSQA